MKFIKVENWDLFASLAEEYGIIQSESDWINIGSGEEEYGFVVVLPEPDLGFEEEEDEQRNSLTFNPITYFWENSEGQKFCERFDGTFELVEEEE